MKPRFASLFGCIFLFAAIPVCADGVACSGSAEKTQDVKSLVQGIDGQESTVIMGRPPTTTTSGSNFRAKCFFDYPSAELLVDSEMFLTPPVDGNVQAFGPDHFDFYNSPSSFVHFDREGRKAKRDGKTAKHENTNSSPLAVPEPGALPLTLFGVISIGLLFRRRGVAEGV
jgi:hypothetical protein